MEGKHFIYLPYIYYAPLSLCRDEQFRKICMMQGISFDLDKRNGTLFFHIDKIVGGCISTLFVSDTWRKCLVKAINTLNIIVRHFGKDGEYETKKYSWESLLSILFSLQNILKKQNQNQKMKMKMTETLN